MTLILRILLFVVTAVGAGTGAGQGLPDAPDPALRPSAASYAAPTSYGQALAAWKNPEDIALFAGARFRYDRARALTLAESPDARAARPAIHAPDALYANPAGVCIDLARFGVETLNRIDPAFEARYLMLEFEPVVIEGRTLRRHWIASFRRDGKLWFFADSRRPGHVAGPYASVDAFIDDYARYRGQPIVAWREADTFARRTRTLAARERSVPSQ